MVAVGILSREKKIWKIEILKTTEFRVCFCGFGRLYGVLGAPGGPGDLFGGVGGSGGLLGAVLGLLLNFEIKCA